MLSFVILQVLLAYSFQMTKHRPGAGQASDISLLSLQHTYTSMSRAVNPDQFANLDIVQRIFDI